MIISEGCEALQAIDVCNVRIQNQVAVPVAVSEAVAMSVALPMVLAVDGQPIGSVFLSLTIILSPILIFNYT